MFQVEPKAIIKIWYFSYVAAVGEGKVGVTLDYKILGKEGGPTFVKGGIVSIP